MSRIDDIRERAPRLINRRHVQDVTYLLELHDKALTRIAKLEWFIGFANYVNAEDKAGAVRIINESAREMERLER